MCWKAFPPTPGVAGMLWCVMSPAQTGYVGVGVGVGVGV